MAARKYKNLDTSWSQHVSQIAAAMKKAAKKDKAMKAAGYDSK